MLPLAIRRKIWRAGRFATGFECGGSGSGAWYAHAFAITQGVATVGRATFVGARIGNSTSFGASFVVRGVWLCRGYGETEIVHARGDLG